VVIWAIALISLCSRRDIEIHAKLAWVVTVLVLNTLGALIYFFFGPSRQSDGAPEGAPVTPEGEAWNPILGENRMADGEGLNPKKRETDEPTE
jgi:hypothetical protein